MRIQPCQIWSISLIESRLLVDAARKCEMKEISVGRNLQDPTNILPDPSKESLTYLFLVLSSEMLVCSREAKELL